VATDDLTGINSYELREVGQRPFSLRFSRFILDCLARNTAEDHRLMDELLQKEGPEGFAAAWLRHHGYQDKVEQDGDAYRESGTP
jgi:hypothetical protein